MAKITKVLIHEEEDPFGPGIDLVVALLVFFLIMLVAIASLYKTSMNVKEELKVTKTKLDEYTKSEAYYKRMIGNLQKENERLDEIIRSGESNKYQQFPPNIVLAASDGLEFESGKATLSGDLEKYVRDKLVGQIEKAAEEYNVNTVVVIGHTDGKNVPQKISNVDTSVGGVIAGTVGVETLVPGSNVDLGMMRALAVVTLLKNIQRTAGQMTRIDTEHGFRAYSAGAFLTKEGELAPLDNDNDPKRRRIEIRFIRRPEQETPLLLDEDTGE
jgi:hypothetical protein